MGSQSSWKRARVERGIYLLPNGKYAGCARRASRLWSRTVGTDLVLARRPRRALIESIEACREPSSSRLRFGTVANWWLARFEAKSAAGARREWTLESHPLPPRASSPAAHMRAHRR
jgi:hypothetical protein